MYDEDVDEVYRCGGCGWVGHFEQTADDGSRHAVCCPECGSDLRGSAESPVSQRPLPGNVSD
jgi:hypothetical protein